MDWLKKHWLKLVGGCGCLMFLVCGGFIGLLFIAASAIKETTSYTEPLMKAQAHPQIVEALGEPIEPGFPSFNSNTALNGVTTNDLQIPVSGPKGEGIIMVNSTCKGSQCTFQTMAFQSPTGESINLLTE